MTAAHWRRQLNDAAVMALQCSAPSADVLAADLYERWYAPAAASEASASIAVAAEAVAARYRAADAAGRRFEPGWKVVHPGAMATRPTSAFQVAATNGRKALWLDPIDFVHPAGIGTRPLPGATLLVNNRRRSVGPPGWWSTYSDSFAACQTMGEPLLRLYWSVQARHVGRLVGTITSHLDAAAPYALKAPLDLDRCRRPDGVVVYLPRRSWEGAADAVQRAHAAASVMLRPAVPALTRPLAHGLGLAEDPGSVSFGMARCRAVAAGMWPAVRRPGARPETVALAAETELRTEGVRIEAPYLQPGSKAEYVW